MTLFPKCQHSFSDDSNVLRVVSTYSTTAVVSEGIANRHYTIASPPYTWLIFYAFATRQPRKFVEDGQLSNCHQRHEYAPRLFDGVHTT